MVLPVKLMGSFAVCSAHHNFNVYIFTKKIKYTQYSLFQKNDAILELCYIELGQV